jgi:O-antigen ligase
MMALNDLNNYFIGEGTGNFGFILFGFDSNGYPHNIFVELFYENGIIGLLLFLSLLFSTLWRSVHINNRIKRVLFTVSILFFLFASMTSGDITGNPFLFIFIVYANYCYLDSYNSNKFLISK